MIFPDIRHDYLLHSFYGLLIAFPLVFFLGVYGLIIALIGFALKELIIDLALGRGESSFKDFIFGAIPAIILFIVREFNQLGL